MGIPTLTHDLPCWGVMRRVWIAKENPAVQPITKFARCARMIGPARKLVVVAHRSAITKKSATRALSRLHRIAAERRVLVRLDRAVRDLAAREERRVVRVLRVRRRRPAVVVVAAARGRLREAREARALAQPERVGELLARGRVLAAALALEQELAALLLGVPDRLVCAKRRRRETRSSVRAREVRERENARARDDRGRARSLPPEERGTGAGERARSRACA